MSWFPRNPRTEPVATRGRVAQAKIRFPCKNQLSIRAAGRSTGTAAGSRTLRLAAQYSLLTVTAPKKPVKLPTSYLTQNLCPFDDRPAPLKRIF